MTTKEFILYAGERPELCEKMSACKAPKEGYVLAQNEGLTDDFETFVKVMTETKAEAEELNEDDLDIITAAGTATDCAIASVVTGVSSLFVAIASAV